MKIKTFLLFTAIFACIIVYSLFAVRKESGAEFAVSIDLSKPLAIEWPCEVSFVGDSGEKGFRIAPKVGRGWRGEAGGKASYRFFIPEDGRYHIWAYCLWFDECANAVFAQIDEQDKAIVGNDPVYKKWHWVRGFDVNLTKGTHSLLLSNHSDHVSLQKIVFSHSASAEPQQTGLVFSDIFYEGFDGCDQGNFTRWQQISGSWLVQNPDSGTCLIENSLIGKSQDKAFITYKNSDWQDYSLDISVKVLPFDLQDCAIGICFGLTDPNDFYQLKIQPVPNSKTAKMGVIDKNSEIISEFELAFEIDKWQQIQTVLKDRYLEVHLAENNPIRIETTQKITGGIGLLLEGEMTAYFDNIHVRQILETKTK
ncbi:MAG: hypothetical protein ACYS9Y_03405 [Planctomycetota bacterium]